MSKNDDQKQATLTEATDAAGVSCAPRTGSQGWVSAANPPPEAEHVMLYFEAGGLCPCAIGYYVDPERWFEIKGDDCDETDAPPTHWMPLPADPVNTTVSRDAGADGAPKPLNG